MPEFYGPLAHVTVVSSLWLALAFPFAAAVFCAFVALRAHVVKSAPQSAPAAAASHDRIATAAIGGVVLAFAASAYHFAILLRKPDEERYLLQHVWRMVR